MALYFAAKDRRVPWYAKVVAGCVAAYALSPLDLIPDFIPVLGYLDDIILVPLGIALAIRLIPPDLLEEHRRKAEAQAAQRPSLGLPRLRRPNARLAGRPPPLLSRSGWPWRFCWPSGWPDVSFENQPDRKFNPGPRL
jgi:uncharacterized membrane protein YkvA (DUF1232 family)